MLLNTNWTRVFVLDLVCTGVVVFCGSLVIGAARSSGGELRAGSAVVEITPEKLPVIVNGGMLTRTVDRIKTPLYARGLALAGSNERLVLVVVDSCMLPRPLIDEVKSIAAEKYGIAPDHLMISATHCHSAPSCMGALGTDEDPQYIVQLRRQLAQVIGRALERLEPAEVGYGSIDAGEFTALRRWVRRPDRIAEDPFGNLTVRANMHAASNWDDVTGPSGPEDPELSLLAVRTKEGKPLAVLANFSMHYFGDADISADYFGLFCEQFSAAIGGEPSCVTIFSHGCSGDIWKRDYALPPDQRRDEETIEDYAARLVQRALPAYQAIQYSDEGPVRMLETRMTLRYRTPDLQRLQWARRIVEAMGDRSPETTTEVYAREQIILAQRQQTEIVLQGVRIGEIAIATTPNETYAISGLKIKAASPFGQTMVIELANGGDGYIPPPEQHLLGGYNTWAARSAGLEVQAEPKIVEGAIVLMERLAGRPRRRYEAPPGPAAAEILALKPALWWELDEFSGPRAHDRSGHHRDGFYESGVTFFLEGPQGKELLPQDPLGHNRGAMFAGGRVHGTIDVDPQTYTLSLWCWNGMPSDGRGICGWLFSRGDNFGTSDHGEHLALLGQTEPRGRLAIFRGDEDQPLATGKHLIERWQWHHIVLVRDLKEIRLFVDGELDCAAPLAPSQGGDIAGAERMRFGDFFLGGHSSTDSSWEGRLDQFVLFPRALRDEEVRRLGAPR